MYNVIVLNPVGRTHLPLYNVHNRKKKLKANAAKQCIFKRQLSENDTIYTACDTRYIADIEAKQSAYCIKS